MHAPRRPCRSVLGTAVMDSALNKSVNTQVSCFIEAVGKVTGETDVQAAGAAEKSASQVEAAEYNPKRAAAQ